MNINHKVHCFASNKPRQDKFKNKRLLLLFDSLFPCIFQQSFDLFLDEEKEEI